MSSNRDASSSIISAEISSREWAMMRPGTVDHIETKIVFSIETKIDGRKTNHEELEESSAFKSLHACTKQMQPKDFQGQARQRQRPRNVLVLKND